MLGLIVYALLKKKQENIRQRDTCSGGKSVHQHGIRRSGFCIVSGIQILLKQTSPKVKCIRPKHWTDLHKDKTVNYFYLLQRFDMFDDVVQEKKRSPFEEDSKKILKVLWQKNIS